MADPSSFQQKLGRYGLLAVVTWGCLEAVSCVGGKILKAKRLYYDEQNTSGFAEYMGKRDPVLGWPSPSRPVNEDNDGTGARPLPAFPDPSQQACITLYGDSFTFGEEADTEHAWANVLARKAQCRVSNYGIGGYGTDQAYLRYLQNRSDTTKIAILGILSENITRNVNRFRNIISPGARFGLKPRFILDAEGELKLLPLPTPTEQEFRRIVESPETTLAYEYFAPGGPSGILRLRFPYTLSILRLFSNYRIRASLRKEPYHAEFYDPQHPSNALGVTVAIARAFSREASARGALPLVVTIPLPGDVTYYREHKRWVYAPLLEALEAAHISYINTGERIESAAGADPCKLYTQCAGGHFNSEGYRIVGENVYDWLKQHRLL